MTPSSQPFPKNVSEAAVELSQLEDLNPQERGRAFERLIGRLLIEDELSYSPPYRPKGEQLDGAFWFQGRTFLIEGKWLQRPVSASDIYVFKSKVDGKLIGTMGIFISMSGYSDDAEIALKSGKSVNVLLWDRSDLEAVGGSFGFSDLLKAKLYLAGRTGVVQMPWPDMVKAGRIRRKAIRTRGPVVILVADKEQAAQATEVADHAVQSKGLDPAKVQIHWGAGTGWLGGLRTANLAHVIATEALEGGNMLVLIKSDPERGATEIRRETLRHLERLPTTWGVEVMIVESGDTSHTDNGFDDGLEAALRSYLDRVLRERE